MTRAIRTSFDRNPYLIEGPALISFSGGRSSGYMLWHILQAHGGKLPDDVHVVFANTGKERKETIDFVHDCADHWQVPITMIERSAADGATITVNHNSISRAGEPFAALTRSKGYLPNPVTRFCTVELKIRPMRDFMRERGYKEWTVVIGLRADERRRIAKATARNDAGKEPWQTYAPMGLDGTTKRHVAALWSEQPFDLRLPNVNGSTPAGSCDLCFLKGGKTLLGLIRQNPELANWWAEAEAEAEAESRASKPSGARFRSDRPSYAEMQRMVRDQGDMFADLDDDTRPCGCHD